MNPRNVPAYAVAALLMLFPAHLAAQAYSSAYQQLSAARQQLRSAQADIDQLTAKVKADLASEDPKWARLQSSYEAALKHRTELRGRLTKAFYESSDYKAGQEQIKKAEQKMLELTDARNSAQPEFEYAANAAWEARASLRKLQQTEVDNVPELRAAEADLTHARELRDAYWDNYVSTVLENSPAWAAAIKKRDDAASAVKAAESQASEARRQAAANRQPRQYTPRSSRGSRGTARSNRSSGRRGMY